MDVHICFYSEELWYLWYQEEDGHVMAMTILALSQPGVATVVS